MNNIRKAKRCLENDSNTISASEVNRYTYCPYQWYYERVYGRKELRKLAAERNRELGLSDTRMSHLKKGLEYHKKEYQIYRINRFIKKVIVILSVGLIIYFLIRMQMGV